MNRNTIIHETTTAPQWAIVAHDLGGFDDTIDPAAFADPTADDLTCWEPVPALDFDATRLAWHTARSAYIAADDAAWDYLVAYGEDATYRALCADRELAGREEIAAFATYMAATREAA